MLPLPFDKMHFLEPAHEHYLADIAHLADLPPAVSGYLPVEIEDLLGFVQEATSIAFASLNRLDDVLSHCLERLTILPQEQMKAGDGSIQCKSSPPHGKTPILCSFRDANYLICRF
jgi:hypothetical protein